ncbi:hypothetical protein ACS0TY_021205 [Phlomoides rotata]
MISTGVNESRFSVGEIVQIRHDFPLLQWIHNQSFERARVLERYRFPWMTSGISIEQSIYTSPANFISSVHEKIEKWPPRECLALPLSDDMFPLDGDAFIAVDQTVVVGEGVGEAGGVKVASEVEAGAGDGGRGAEIIEINSQMVLTSLIVEHLNDFVVADLKANTECTGYTTSSNVVRWFWEVVEGFNKENMARLLQFVTGTSKVPLEGFKALQGISGPQKFQIHKAYGAPERLPSAHTCFNQLDLPEYSSKEQLQERLLLAIHEASEGFGFG